MNKKLITADEIFARTIRNVAPLPCQEDYLRQLASILSFHIHRNYLMDEGYLTDDLPDMSAIVVAPTGQGKTFLLRKMVESVGLNLITVDCSTLAAEGWKGVGLGQRLLTAQKEAKDKNAFERSVLFLDEVDKLHFWGTSSDQGNPVTNILQLYNSGCVVAEGSGKEVVNIDVTRFTVLLGGAFEGIGEIIEKRLTPKYKIGFGRESMEKKISVVQRFQQVTKEDLAAYGMLPELLGRIGTILTIHPPTLEDYRQLLRGENGSIQCQYQNYLRGLYGASFALTDAAVDSIAQTCMESHSGTRAVTPVVNNMMHSALSAAERDENINGIVLDADEQGLCVRYEYGKCIYCYSHSSGAELRVYRLRGKTCKALVDKLCRYFKNTGGDLTIIPVLQAFLECSMEYLYETVEEKEFSFTSLEMLARRVQHKHQCSRFDILMSDRKIKAYERFRELYTSDMQRNIVMALQRIMAYLESYHGKVNIRFVVIKKKLT